MKPPPAETATPATPDDNSPAAALPTSSDSSAADDPDPLAVSEAVSSPAESAPNGNVAKIPPSLTLEEAAARIDPQVMQALADKFNGSLAEVRATDDKDQFL